MRTRFLVGTLALAATLLMALPPARAFDDSKYPDLKGQWQLEGRPRWAVEGQKPPLTPEYQAVYDANLADMATGGQGDVTSAFCLPQGMPMMMNFYDPMEIIVTPTITYILISHVNDSYRRIYTDGRTWPADVETTFAGYSIGKWTDEDANGRYNTLEIETRFLRGPHVYDSTGVPFHKDNQAVIKERIALDKSDPNLLLDEVTVIDHALTRPWTTIRKARRNSDPQPVWRHEVCAEGNAYVRVGREIYTLSADGRLMPVKKNQPPPDLTYFKQREN